MRNMNDDSGAVVRLDIALVERGVTDSRSKAQRLIESGKVRVNGTVASKASLKVTAADTLDLINSFFPFPLSSSSPQSNSVQ